MIPRTLFDEINAFLEENGITKVQLVKEGYEDLKSKKENGNTLCKIKKGNPSELVLYQLTQNSPRAPHIYWTLFNMQKNI